MTRSRTLLAAASVSAFALAGCGGSSSSSTPAAAPATTAAAPATAPAASGAAVAVQISGYAYQPSTVTVKAGTKITFTNHDQTPHTATVQGVFDTGSIATNASGSITPTKAGRFNYICLFHPFMKGTVVVTG